MKKNLLLLSFLCFINFLNAQITTTVNPTIAQMQSVLQGNGVIISGLTVSCPAGSYGLFGNGAGALGPTLNSGIVLTTGSATNVAGPSSNLSSYDNQGPGSALGNTLSAGTSTNGCSINFMITPTCNTLSIRYVFASEEYPTYVGGTYNDVFGFVISGPNPAGGNYNQQNTAIVPGTASTPVSINNVNSSSNNASYQTFTNLIYNAGTTVLTASASVVPCQTYTMTIGVWDVFDWQYDSGVFLDVNGLSCVGSPTLVTTASPSVMCSSQTVTLTTTGGLPSGTYTWAAPPSGGLVSTNGATVTANPTGNTTYTVSYTDMNSCPGTPITELVTVTFSASPPFPVTASPVSICAGQSSTLTANGGAGTYTWVADPSLSSTTGSVVIANPTVTTTYTVTQTAGGCTSTTVITIPITSASGLTVTPNGGSICPGQAISLTASGGSTYTWTAGSGANPPAVATITVSPATTTSYTVLSTCSASAVATVTVSTAPSVTINPSLATVCAGQSAILTASGGSTYTWTASSGATPPNAAIVTVSPAATTNYTVVTGVGTCTASAVATVSVQVSNTSVTASAANYCIGGTPVTLTASGAASYAWSPGTGLNATTSAVVSATPAVTTVYTVTGTSGLCNSTATVSVTVLPTSTVTIVNSGTLICDGGSTPLTASGATTYTWLPTNQTTASINANPSATTTYTVGGQTAAGCMAIPAVITISVSPAIIPVATVSGPTVCLSQTVALSVTPNTGSYTYNWSPASEIQGPSNTAAVVAKPSALGNVIYTVTVSNGVCTGTATVNLLATSCTAPTATISVSSNSICSGGCVTFTAATSGSQPMTYEWIFPGGTPPTSNLANPQVCYPSKGSYSVGLVVTNLYGSDTTLLSNYISVADTPAVFHAGRDTSLNIGQTTTLYANGTGASYYWYPNVNNNVACPTCSSTVVQPTVTTKYYVEISNSPYCKRRDSVLVKVDFVCGDFFVPNAFSPNGDGLNDLINVHGFCVGSYNFQIFNRWGEKVFETTSRSEGWDGTFRGKNMDTGVFVYKVEGLTIEGKPFSLKGNITLIR